MSAPVLAGEAPTMMLIRGLLEAASTARRDGDRGLADALESEVLVTLRRGLQPPRREASA
jgi:hypothetical protein